MKGILGRKAGMTEVFTKDGKLIPVTVIEVEPNVVMQVKTVEKNGYNAIQLGVFDKKEKNASNPEIGNAKKAKTNPKRFLKEIRDFEGSYNLGDVISADVFAVGDVIDATGTSKGKGFQGVIKRHNQSRGPMSHGSHFHRKPGSMGTMLYMRVPKGKKLPGHMGFETVTIQNLEIIEVNSAENYILVSGNVPGPKKSMVILKSAVKNSRKANPKELVKYEEEAIVEEVVETTDAVEPVVEENVAVETEVKEEVVETTEEVTEEVKENVESTEETEVTDEESK